MDTPLPSMKPVPMADLLLGMPAGILSKEVYQTLTAKKQKQPGHTISTAKTAEKTYKPMTSAEIQACYRRLTNTSPKKNMQHTNSMRKKWNSSVNIEKKVVSHNGNNQMKYNSVRKTLNFQHPKPKIVVTKAPSSTHMKPNTITPEFIKPEIKVKRTLNLQTRNTVRISGINHIAETPEVIQKFKQSRMTIANKENISGKPGINKIATTPKSFKRIALTPKSTSLYKRLMSKKPDTPLSNESWASSCDDSFIQREKDSEQENIQTENVAMSIGTLEDIEEVSPPTSTPFKEYRNINECSNNSSNVVDESITDLLDNTMKWADKTTVNIENTKREESVIVSLCNMLNKATVSQPNTEVSSTGLDLIEVKKQTLKKINMIENCIKMLNSVKETELKTLQNVCNLISDGQRKQAEMDKDKTVIETTKENLNQNEITPVKSTLDSKPSIVIKSCLKSPSYKIRNVKMSTLKKKVHYRSLPNVSHFKITPDKYMGDRAMSMYLKIKNQNMDFLSTPAGKRLPETTVMDTPAIASHNLQKQLDKLYN